MKIRIFNDTISMGAAAAIYGAEKIRQAISEKGEATIIIATGASQFQMMEKLVKSPDIDWSRVRMFHLDEYVGLPESHPASFRKYIRERFIQQLPGELMDFNLVNGEGDAAKNASELGETIKRYPVDVAFIGIGENGHIAFNDPPADFETETPYLVVNLDDACRKQQMGEGWFPTFDDVPSSAISMSVRHILKSKAIVNTVPDARKAEAVKGAVEGLLGPECPASVLRIHPDCTTFLDVESASGLSKITQDFCTE